MNNFRLREVTKGSIPPDALCVGGNVNGMVMFTHLKSRVAKPLFSFEKVSGYAGLFVYPIQCLMGNW